EIAISRAHPLLALVVLAPPARLLSPVRASTLSILRPSSDSCSRVASSVCDCRHLGPPDFDSRENSLELPMSNVKCVDPSHPATRPRWRSLHSHGRVHKRPIRTESTRAQTIGSHGNGEHNGHSHRT